MSTAQVLIVDDVNMFLEIGKGFLRSSAVRILTARDGEQALAVMRSERPSLVFMDLHMPNMNGAECCAAVKKDPLLKPIPIIMMTSIGKDEDRELCQKAGCDDFITKPLDRDAFLEKARRFIPSIDRRETRVPIHSKVKFKAHGVTLSGECVDVGQRGLYIAADYEIDLGCVLDMEIILPGLRERVIRAKGSVVWLNTKKERNKPALPEGFGVEFHEMERACAGELMFFLERALSKG